MRCTKMEEDFYCNLNISPIGLLSDCQYENEYRLGEEFGNDVCIHENETGFECDNCKNGKPIHVFYPPITDDLMINFLLVCGIDEELATKQYYTNDDKRTILCYVQEKCYRDEEIRVRIRDLIIGHLQDWGKM